jgi:C-terminal processing protease CtpA/Prc
MRGNPGSKVRMTVGREGWAEPQDLVITREQIQIQSVRAQNLGDGIEYVKVRHFQEETAHDLDGRRRVASDGRAASRRDSLRLTTAHWFSPKGRPLGMGLTPDVAVDGDDGQLQAAVGLVSSPR